MSASTLPAGLLLVAASALGLRLLPAARADARPWVEVLLACGAGLGLAGVGGLWTSAFFLPEAPGVISTPDFAEYCGSVAHYIHGEWWRWSSNRSTLAGGPAILLSPWLGVVDGLLVGALVGQFLTGAGLYLWGRAIHSRAAGLAAALLAATVVPLAVLGRTLTYYPVLVGFLTLGTGLVAVAWRWPRPPTFLLGGAGVALCLLVDPRGLLWGLSLGGMLLLAVLVQAIDRNWKRGLSRLALGLAAVGLPVWLAWAEADRAYLPQTTTLEELGDPTKGWETHVRVLSDPNVPMTAERGYIWGRSSLWNVPDTLRFLHAQSQRVPDEIRHSALTQRGKEAWLEPYLGWVAASGVVAAIGLWRHPARLLLLLGTCVPFVAVLRGAVDMRFANLRFLGNGMVFIPLLIGVGLAVLAGTGRTGRSRLPWRLPAAVLLVLATVLGTLPTDLSPSALWRDPLPANLGNTVREHLNDAGDGRMWPRCQVQMNQDRAKGQPTWLKRLPPAGDSTSAD